MGAGSAMMISPHSPVGSRRCCLCAGSSSRALFWVICILLYSLPCGQVWASSKHGGWVPSPPYTCLPRSACVMLAKDPLPTARHRAKSSVYVRGAILRIVYNKMYDMWYMYRYTTLCKLRTVHTINTVMNFCICLHYFKMK